MQSPFGEKNLAINRILGRTFLNPLGREAYLLAGRRAHLGRRSRVLDVGSGRGTGAILLAKRFGCAVTGIDASTAMVADAIRRADRTPGLPVGFRVSSLKAFARRASFDLVCCFDVLGFIPGRRQTIRRLASLLRRGGWLCLTDYFRTRDSQAARSLAAAWNVKTLASRSRIVAGLDAAHLALFHFEDTTERYREHWQRISRRLTARRRRIIAAVGNAAFLRYRQGVRAILAATAEGSFGHAFILAQRMR